MRTQILQNGTMCQNRCVRWKSSPITGHKSLKFLPRAEQKDDSGNFGDDLLDFMYAGKKLRKWYGQEGKVLPKDGRPDPEVDTQQDQQPQQDEGEGDAIDIERDQVLVIDTESPMSEQALLQLIIDRVKVKALVKDTVIARSSFGPYIDAIQLTDLSNGPALRAAMHGVKTIVCCGKIGEAVIREAAATGVPHVVLLSLAATGRGASSSPTSAMAMMPFFLFNRELAVLSDKGREQQVLDSNVVYTIIKAAGLEESPGGCSTLEFSSTGGGTAVSKEDIAKVVAEAALRDIRRGGSLVVNVQSKGPGQLPDNWETVFGELAKQRA